MRLFLIVYIVLVLRCTAFPRGRFPVVPTVSGAHSHRHEPQNHAASPTRPTQPPGAVGHVTIAGCGLSINHLTLEVVEAILSADVVLYDDLSVIAGGDGTALERALVSRGFHGARDLTKRCTFIGTGKRGGRGRGTPVQRHIDQTMVAHALGGKRVVRLKCGDPFVFGRSRSEVEALRCSGVSYTVLPGISSALAAPLCAGIPLTDPDLSRTFAVLSGFRRDEAYEAVVTNTGHSRQQGGFGVVEELRGANAVDTLVFLMAGNRVGELAQAAVEAGRSPDTPCAIIHNAFGVSTARSGFGCEEERGEVVLRGTLRNITQVVASFGKALSPAVFVMGAAASLDLLDRHRSDQVPAVLSDSFMPVMECDTFIFDMDGVIFEGSDFLPGAAETIVELQRRGKRCLFVTNNSVKSRAAYARKLAAVGVDVGVDEVVTSSWATANYISSVLHPPEKPRKVLVIGEDALVEELHAAGVRTVLASQHPSSSSSSSPPRGITPSDFKAMRRSLDPEVDAVVLGYTPQFDYAQLCLASAYIANGCKFIATNPDVGNRVGAALMPENGAAAAAIQAVTGQAATFVGKPSPTLSRTLCSAFSLEPDKTVMIGDRIDTDIAFGAGAGFRTILVLSGVTSREEADMHLARCASTSGYRSQHRNGDIAGVAAATVPDLVLEGVSSLLGLGLGEA